MGKMLRIDDTRGKKPLLYYLFRLIKCIKLKILSMCMNIRNRMTVICRQLNATTDKISNQSRFVLDLYSRMKDPCNYTQPIRARLEYSSHFNQ